MVTAWVSFPFFRAFSLRADPSQSALCGAAVSQIQNLSHISLKSQRKDSWVPQYLDDRGGESQKEKVLNCVFKLFPNLWLTPEPHVLRENPK